jgi:three-Cys-motif partner protein
MSSIPSTVWPLLPHSKAKHEILEEYLKAWLPIMSKYSGRIIYLDGFAGPGIYEGNEEGSPVIALRTAVDHSLKHLFQEIMFVFIEKDPDRATKLSKVLGEKFPNLPKNIKYLVIGAEFAPTLERVLQEIQKNKTELAPTLAFLDPFGFSGFPMKLLGKLMQYNKCEILVTFMINFVRRFHDDLRENALNELFETDEWKKAREIQDPEKNLRFS